MIWMWFEFIKPGEYIIIHYFLYSVFNTGKDSGLGNCGNLVKNQVGVLTQKVPSTIQQTLAKWVLLPSTIQQTFAKWVLLVYTGSDTQIVG